MPLPSLCQEMSSTLGGELTRQTDTARRALAVRLNTDFPLLLQEHTAYIMFLPRAFLDPAPAICPPSCGTTPFQYPAGMTGIAPRPANGLRVSVRTEECWMVPEGQPQAGQVRTTTIRLSMSVSLFVPIGRTAPCQSTDSPQPPAGLRAGI